MAERSRQHSTLQRAKLAAMQRQFSRKQPGSCNREKCRLKLAKLHEHAANQRRDFLHKLSRKLVDVADIKIDRREI